MTDFNPSNPRKSFRRESLRVIFILLLVISTCVAHQDKKQPRIIIVGAGVSGIAAASRLIESGFTSIKILEAENRIGGRINSVNTGNWTVDLGGHWVHGETGNAAYDIAAPLGLVSNETTDYENELFFFSDNFEMKNNLLDIIDNHHDEIYNATEIAERTDSLYDLLKEKITPYIKSNQNDAERESALFSWIAKDFCFAEGCDSIKDVSTKGLLHYKAFEGNNLVSWKGRGYKSIIDLLLKRHEKSQGTPIELEKYLELEKEVTSIRKENGGVEVKCKDGSRYTGDLVIVTVSLGVLKNSHETLFKPSLPEQKRRAIQGLGIGTIDKIILRFPNIWWNSNITGFNIVWLEKDKVLKEGQFPWEQEILAYNMEEGSPYTLTAWLVGKAARNMETYSLEEVTKGAMRTLRKFVGKKYSIPEPVEVLRSSWGTNPHFKGAYSYRSMATEALNVSAADLAKPVTDENGKEVILFAGEATNSNHYATVHGALETGWREADRIINLYKQS